MTIHNQELKLCPPRHSSTFTIFCFLTFLGNTGILNAAIIVNPSFESAEVVTGTVPTPFPTTFGDWKGDTANIVGNTLGITPRSGNSMLQFVQTNTGAPGATGGSDVFQLINVSGDAAAISTGNAVATLTYYANRIVGDSQTDTSFVIQVRAMSGSPANFVSMVNSPIALGGDEIFSDADPNTWEAVSTEFTIPVTTSYLAVSIVPTENIFNDLVDPEFDGHFADDVSITITVVPEPSTFALIALGLWSLVCGASRKL